MNYEIACFRARLMAQLQGRAAFVIRTETDFEVTTDPPHTDCIRYSATVPHLHPEK